MRTLLGAALALLLFATACGDSEEAASPSPAIVVDGAAVDTSDESGETADSDGNAGTGNATDQTDEELALEFAQCMRDEGVDFPDPTINADGSVEFFGGQGGAGAQAAGIDPDDPAVTDAFETCGEILEGASFLPGAGIDQSELEDTLLEFTQCLRDLGFDVDDPDLSNGFGPGAGGGGGGAGGLFGPNFDPQDPANQDAIQECQAVFGADGPLGGGGQGGN